MICILIKMTRNTSFILILFLSPIDSTRRDIFNSDQQTKSLNSPRPAVAEPIQIQKTAESNLKNDTIRSSVFLLQVEASSTMKKITPWCFAMLTELAKTDETAESHDQKSKQMANSQLVRRFATGFHKIHMEEGPHSIFPQGPPGVLLRACNQYYLHEEGILPHWDKVGPCDLFV